MKTKFMIFYVLCSGPLYAGTPGIGNVTVLYGIILLFRGGMIGSGYLVNFIKKKLREYRDEKMGNDLNEPAHDSESADDQGSARG